MLFEYNLTQTSRTAGGGQMPKVSPKMPKSFYDRTSSLR